jgi:hypothetical protein
VRGIKSQKQRRNCLDVWVLCISGNKLHLEYHKEKRKFPILQWYEWERERSYGSEKINNVIYFMKLNISRISQKEDKTFCWLLCKQQYSCIHKGITHWSDNVVVIYFFMTGSLFSIFIYFFFILLLPPIRGLKSLFVV